MSKNVKKEKPEPGSPDTVYEKWKKWTTGAWIAVLVIIGLIFWIFVFDEIKFAFAFLGLGLVCSVIVYALFLLLIDHCASMAKIARNLEERGDRDRENKE